MADIAILAGPYTSPHSVAMKQVSPPPRRPLQEQSDSQTNRSVTPVATHFLAAPVYSKTPFPRLASQEFLPPQPKTSTTDREDGRSAYPRPNLPPRSALRRSNTNSSSNLRGDATQSSIRAVRSSEPDSLAPSDQRRPLPSIPDNYEELRRSTHELLLLASDFEAPRVDLQAREDQSSGRFPADDAGLPNVTIRPRRGAPRRSLVRASVASSASSETLAPEERLGGFRVDRRLPSITSQAQCVADRVMSSPLADQQLPPPQINHWPGFDTGSTYSPSLSHRRSASSPITPSEQFLASLNDGILPLQYPKLRQPSGLGLHADVFPSADGGGDAAFTAGTIYPQPLTIRRKRAISNFSRTASFRNASSQPSASEPAASITARVRTRAPTEGGASATSGTTGTSSEIVQRYRPLRTVGLLNAAEVRATQLDDTVAELHGRTTAPLGLQRPAFRLETPSSRPGSNKSTSSSHFGSFYNFFNDSVTNFARVYYRGDAKLRLDSPPVVQSEFNYHSQPPFFHTHAHTDARSLTPHDFSSPLSATQPPGMSPDSAHSSSPPNASPQTPRVSNSHSHPHRRHHSLAGSSLPANSNSHSPTSTGFPDSLYIPRSRALRKQHAHAYANGTPTGTLTTSLLQAPSSSASTQPSSLAIQAIPIVGPHPLTLTSPSARRPNALGLHRRAVSVPQPPSSAGTVARRPAPPPHLSLPRRRRAWRALSVDGAVVDGAAGGRWGSKVDRQIGLFALGFVVPLAWMLAAVLPLPPRPAWRPRSTLSRGSSDIEAQAAVPALPPRPDQPSMAEKTRAGYTADDTDVEPVSIAYSDAQHDLFDVHDVACWQRARWWRNLNRIMSMVGVLIVVAVIACATVAARS